MDRNERKAATAAYKEKKVVSGIYAVRCLPPGQVWLGRAPDLATIQSRLWFTLRQGGHPHRLLQEAWSSYGAEAFEFEIIERIEDDEPAYARERRLKERLEHWLQRLQASRI